LRPFWGSSRPSGNGGYVTVPDTAHGLVTWAVATLAAAAFLGSASTSLIGGAGKEAATARPRYSPGPGAYAGFTPFRYDRVKAPLAGASTVGRPFEADRHRRPSDRHGGDPAADG
jgi:hypothetical protein